MKELAVFNRKTPGIAVLFLSVGILASCIFSDDAEKKKDANSIIIMTWNMQALFDGIDDGNEYDEYRESAGWTQEKYSGRITAISKAIGSMNTVPDIIAMQEIESARVMKDMANSLSDHGYSWTHYANNPGMSLGLGILSRLPITESRTHSSNIDGDTAPRPVLEIRIDRENSAQNGSFVLFICHWKSKLGSEELTENTRRASARIILRRMRELTKQEPELPLIVLGDLNENYDEFYRRNGETICALLPDDPHCAELAGFYDIDAFDDEACAELQKDFIVLSKRKPPKTQYFFGQILSLYSPWAAELKNGSYYYKNDWETIDHFLLSPGLFSGSGWEFDDCSVADYPPFTNSSGHPASYNPRTGSGLSDHLPLLLFLRWKDK